MGELFDLGQDLSAQFGSDPASGMGLLSAVMAVIALAMVALMAPPKNDDDDSGPGGGLMQPVA